MGDLARFVGYLKFSRFPHLLCHLRWGQRAYTLVYLEARFLMFHLCFLSALPASRK